MSLVDCATVVREGEELDLAALEGFLKRQLPDLSGPLTVRQFPSGFSNLTYLIKVGEREMVLRRPPFGTKPKSGHDMGREYRVLSRLKEAFPFCPEALAYCEDEDVLGAPFYVMEKLQGIIVRKDYPAELDLTPEQVRLQHEAFVEVFHRLHAVDYRAAGLTDLGRPEGYCRRQVEGWSRRYRAARTPDAPDFERVMAWLDAKLETALERAGGERSSLVHNDYKLDNVIFSPADPTRIVGVLDWEMTTVGHPLMDLGSTLGYWVESGDPEYRLAIRAMPTNAPGGLTRQELVARYAERSGIEIDNFDFFYCFGMFRLAVIVQQIYYRFYHGQTKDQRFARLIRSARGLEQAALELVDRSTL